jgi:hypothetical protein
MYMTAVFPSHRVTLNRAPIGRIALTYTCDHSVAHAVNLLACTASADARVLASDRPRHGHVQGAACVSC